MQLHTTLTGSFPPLDIALNEEGIKASIEHAIQQQINVQISLLVDGQVRSDIVGIFARSIGLEGNGLPYQVTGRLGKLPISVTLPDLETAAAAAGGRRLKAHITGPTLMAESCLVSEKTPDVYKGESGFQSLTLDLAEALAEEARYIAHRAKDLNIQFLQIDEPSLVYGANLDLAREAIGVVVRAWREAGGGETLLHVCGDIRDILDGLSRMPVDIFNVENIHLREADEDAVKIIRDSGKKLALGIVPVNNQRIPLPRRVARELVYARERYGADTLWGATPNCGLHLSDQELAMRRMACLVEAVKSAQEADRAEIGG